MNFQLSTTVNCLLVAAVLGIGFSAASVSAQDNWALGKSLYQMGETLDGSPVSAIVMSDVRLSGMMVACGKCHRRSGYGNEEPGKLTPSITAGQLFSRKTLRRARQFRSLFQEPQTEVESIGPRVSHDRAAYTEQSLARAIRTGIDSSGRKLNPLMPRYDLDDQSMMALIAYLQWLARSDDPGVDATTIHFALVSTDDVDSATHQAVRQVIDAYVSDHNREVMRYQVHAGESPNYKDDFIESYRLWQVHDWQLSGEPYTYGAQLSHYMRSQMVFALLGGVSHQSWQPIHQFCDHHEIPCLFPNTPLPEPHADGGYTLYLHEGLRAEADAFCLDILQFRDRLGISPLIHQFAMVDTVGEQSLRYTTSRLSENGFKAIDHLMQKTSDVAREMTQLTTQGDVALAWLDEDHLALAGAWQRPHFDQIYFSGTLLPEPPADFDTVPNIALLSPYRDESLEHPRAYRVRSWMRSRRITLTHQRLQYNTYFALTVTDHALRHLVDRYSRDYLIERVEHETENALSPGIYPALSLGPQQRYASRNVEIIRLP